MKRSALTTCLLLAAVALIASAGCAYRVGYTELRADVKPVEGSRAWPVAISPLIAVTGFPTPESPTLRVQLLRRRAVERAASRRLSGLPVCAEYDWTNFLVKPIFPLTAVLACIMPQRHRNDRDADGWDLGDRLRDAIAWMNPFEAMPINQQRSGEMRVTVREGHGSAVFVQERIPLAGRSIWLYVGNERVQAALTDERGEVTFDLREVASKLPAEGQAVVALSSFDARRRVVLPPDVVAAAK